MHTCSQKWLTVTAAACKQVSKSIPSLLWCCWPLHNIHDTQSQVWNELIYDCLMPQINRSFVSLNVLECVMCVYVCESFLILQHCTTATFQFRYISNLRSTWKCTPIHSKTHIETTHMYIHVRRQKRLYIYTDQFIYILEALDWIALNLPYTLAGVLPAKF